MKISFNGETKHEFLSGFMGWDEKTTRINASRENKKLNPSPRHSANVFQHLI